MTQPNPPFLDHDRPPVPDLVVPRGVTPFHLEGKPVRGRLIRLGALADALLSRHAMPEAVSRLMGEALALTAGLAAALKFRGSFSLQAKGEGPVSMLVTDCTDTGELRGYARVDPDRLSQYGKNPSARALLGRGYLAFTCDQGEDMERYQGIVPIEGTDLAEMTGTYFASSEQLRTHVRLACARTPEGWRATAFIMERVATEGGITAAIDAMDEEDAWTTALALASTLKQEELLDDTLEPEALLHRLFHQEGLMVGQSRALAYGCRCSRSRLVGVLEGFAPDDLDHMAEDGTITMTCEFCKYDFRFSRESIDRAAGHA